MEFTHDRAPSCVMISTVSRIRTMLWWCAANGILRVLRLPSVCPYVNLTEVVAWDQVSHAHSSMNPLLDIYRQNILTLVPSTVDYTSAIDPNVNFK